MSLLKSFEDGVWRRLGCINPRVHTEVRNTCFNFKIENWQNSFWINFFFFFFESFYSKAFEIFEIDSKAILLVFYFEIEFIKGDSNSLPGFLSREFLQGKWALKSPNPIQKLQKPLMQCLQLNKKNPILKPKIDSKFLELFLQTKPNQHLPKQPLPIKISNMWLRSILWRYKFLNPIIFHT